MQWDTKIVTEENYNTFRGADWPSYNDFLSGNYTASKKIEEEINSYINQLRTPSNSIEEIYKEFGEQICLFPYLGAFYSTSYISNSSSYNKNVLTPCCTYTCNNLDYQVENSIKDSFNNKKWKSLRKHFLSSDCTKIKECVICSKNEKMNLPSHRQQNNNFYAEHLTIDIVDELKKIIKEEFNVDKIYSLNYMPSNYCDLQCVTCNPGASSSRHSFETKLSSQVLKIVNNKADFDFVNVLEDLIIINFTGGETLLQPQVQQTIDWLIKNNRAKDITLTLLTNATNYYNNLNDKLLQFKNVFVTVSIDGTGLVNDYQRRGSQWDIVEKNALEINKKFGAVINFVLTAINIFSIIDFFDWLNKNNLNKFNITQVDDKPYLTLAVIPNNLKIELIQYLKNNQSRFVNNAHIFKEIQNIIILLEKTKFNQTKFDTFVENIKIENTASKFKLHEVVKEWKPYFE